MNRKEELKAQILELTREYYKEVHAPQPEFIPGKTKRQLWWSLFR